MILRKRAAAAALLAFGAVAAAPGPARAAATTSPAASRDATAVPARRVPGFDPAAYPWRYGDPWADDGHGYFQDSCASFAAWALRSDGLPPAVADHLGAARAWHGSAVDGAPRVGDIAQWDPGVAGADEQGHVAYVAAVHRDGTVTVFEYNWADPYDGYQPDQLSVRRVPVDQPSRYLRF